MNRKTVAVRSALGVLAVLAAFQAAPASARSRHHHRVPQQAEMVFDREPMAYASNGYDSNALAFRAMEGTFGRGSHAAVERQPSLARGVEAAGGLKALVARHAAENGVPFALADAVVKIESGYNPRAANRSGAMGLMQIKTQTARGQGFSGSASALLNPDTNLRYAMRYLATAYRMSGGDICGTVMRYQSGHYAHRMSGADHSYCSKARGLMARA